MHRDEHLGHLSRCLQCACSLESLSARIVNIGSYVPNARLCICVIKKLCQLGASTIISHHQNSPRSIVRGLPSLIPVPAKSPLLRAIYLGV